MTLMRLRPQQSGIRSDTASQGDTGVRGKKSSPLSPRMLIAVLALLALLLGGYFLWPSSDGPGKQQQTVVKDNTGGESDPGSAGPASGGGGSPRPPVEPGSDITVGPEGNFATINEAIAYVQDHFQPLNRTAQQTIRVSGGTTYVESIEIDNSSFSPFRNGISIICSDDAPAILSPKGQDPIVKLVNVERFRLQGFHLAGQGRPVGMRLEGYLVSSHFEDLTIDNVTRSAIEAVGVSGLKGRRVEFRDLFVKDIKPDAVGIAFTPQGQSTQRRAAPQLSDRRPPANGSFSGRGGGPVGGQAVPLRSRQGYRSRILDTGPLDSVMLINNTFREFNHGILFSAVPSIELKGVGFEKNLFTGVHGPEVMVSGGGDPTSIEAVLGQSDARFNWSEGTDDPIPGLLDIFIDEGRRAD